MQVTPTAIPDVLLIEPAVHRDGRGWFYEAWNGPRFADAVGTPLGFVQDNCAASQRHVLRGLHYQVRHQQGKLVSVIAGRVFDVAVDVRPGSPTFAQWVGVEMDGDLPRQLWIPPGFAHGYLVLSDEARLIYKVTDVYSPPHDRAVAWDDPDIGIEWPLGGAEPVLSDRDAAAPRLRDAELPAQAGVAP